MSLTNPNHAVTAKRLQEFHQGILPYLNGPKVDSTIYGMRILRDESVPSAKVVYLEDNAEFEPAHMDYTNNVFDYGSWENAFFMPKPCMLKYDGTVDYYLDPNDYTKKEDGTASDVANTSYGGNAMMEWPKIWLKIVPDATKDNKEADIFISNTKVDNDYTDWNYHNSLGNSVEHFYTPIYNGSLINDKLRSLSGQKIMNYKTAEAELSYAQANNPTGSLIWTTETFVDINLITILLTLIGKSTNSQGVFGQGIGSNGSYEINSYFRTGIHNDKGLFYGTTSDRITTSLFTNAVKVFGMENIWGFINRRYLGHIFNSGSQKVKLTYGTEDGSSTNGYNFTGDGYITTDAAVMGTGQSNYMRYILFSGDGYMLPLSQGAGYPASASTYYCDYVYAYDDGTVLPTVVPHYSGYSAFGSRNGAFFKWIRHGKDTKDWDYGAALSARPLS